MRLVIVRHGATANNVQARYTGQSDVPLSPLGERQAAALAERLRDEHFDALVYVGLAAGAEHCRGGSASITTWRCWRTPRCARSRWARGRG